MNTFTPGDVIRVHGRTYTFRNVYVQNKVVATRFVQDRGSNQYSLEDLANTPYDVVYMSDKAND